MENMKAQDMFELDVDVKVVPEASVLIGASSLSPCTTIVW